MSTAWGEGCLYNPSCPVDTAAHATCLHVPAGSGAVAIAQLMKYYGFPIQGTGEHSYNHPVYGIQYANFGATSYNWSGMPDSLTTGDEQVATLIYQCAIAQDMNFGTTASVSAPDALDSALRRYFGYPAGRWIAKEDTGGWNTVITGELDALRPVILHGTDPLEAVSRFFVCDGYDTAGRWHIRWGWGGLYDGFYPPDSLAPGNLYFTAGLRALTGIFPDPAGGEVLMDFEDTPDFSLSFGSWTVLDADHHDTYGISGYTFPHQNEPMSFLCFNPAAVSPPMTGDPAIQPHGGERFGACFSSNPPANDDWFISPQVKIGPNGSLSFWIKSYTDLYGVDSYSVAVSETDNAPGDFTVISGSQPLQTTTDWTRKIFNLGAYAGKRIYIAIRCTSSDRYLMMIDDLVIRPQAATILSADFIADRTSVRIGDTVNFSDQSAGAPSTWHWEFPGGTPSFSDLPVPPPVRYAAAGTYDVSLKIGAGSTADSLTKTSYVTVTGYPVSLFLDFETVDDFSRSFSPWTVLDVKGGETYGIQNVTFPHAFEPMAYVCFNPSATTPPVTGMTAHAGQKMGCCFSSIPSAPPLPATSPNDKWLISPKVSLGGEPVLQFWVRTYNDAFGEERYFTGVSVAGTDTADFSFLTADAERAPTEWTLRTYDLSSFANHDVHIGIRCVTNDGFIFMLDDISLTSALLTEEISRLGGISVFPNPAGDRLRLGIPPGFTGSVNAELESSCGVPAGTWQIPARPGTVEFDIRHLPSGLYLLRLTGGGECLTRKVIIIHP